MPKTKHLTGLSAERHGLSFNRSAFIGRQRLQIVFLCLATIFLESLCYVLTVQPVYSYEGFTVALSIVKMLEAGLCVTGVALFLPRSVRTPSDFFQHVLFLFPISGMSVLYFMQDRPRLYYYFSIACFFVVLIITRLARFDRVRLPSGSPTIAWFVLGSLLGIAVVNLILTGAWRYFNLDIFQVYETRSATKEMVGGGALGYLSPWAFKIAGPWLFMISIVTRKYGVAIVFFLIQLFIYGSAGHKQYLFSTLFMLILYYYILSANCLNRLFGFVMSIMGIAILEWMLLGSNLLSGVIVRRNFFVPAFLNYAYYLTAEQYGYVWWSDSFLLFLHPYTWSVGTAEMVSYFLWGHVNTHANTGFLGAGYMQAGVLGMVIYSLIIGVLLRVCDAAIVNRMPRRFAMAVVTPSIMSVFDSSDLPAAFLTHGVGLLLVILWLLGGTDKRHADAPLVAGHKVLS